MTETPTGTSTTLHSTNPKENYDYGTYYQGITAPGGNLDDHALACSAKRPVANTSSRRPSQSVALQGLSSEEACEQLRAKGIDPMAIVDGGTNLSRHFRCGQDRHGDFTGYFPK